MFGSKSENSRSSRMLIIMDVTLVKNPSHSLSEPLPCIEEILTQMGGGARLSEALHRIEARAATRGGGTMPLQCELLRTYSQEALWSYALKDRAPIPLAADREGYWGEDHVAYWLTGLGDYLFLRQIIDKGVLVDQAGTALLDLGCASGRVLRHFATNEPAMKLYGCDISRNSVAFIRKYLPNTAVAFQNLPVPPLPIADDSLNFV